MKKIRYYFPEEKVSHYHFLLTSGMRESYIIPGINREKNTFETPHFKTTDISGTIPLHIPGFLLDGAFL